MKEPFSLSRNQLEESDLGKNRVPRKKAKSLKIFQIDNLTTEDNNQNEFNGRVSKSRSDFTDLPQSRRLKIVNFKDPSISKCVTLNLNTNQSLRNILQELGKY